MKCLASAQREAAQLWPPGSPGHPQTTVLVLGTTLAFHQLVVQSILRLNALLVAGAFGGRLDHTLSNLNTALASVTSPDTASHLGQHLVTWCFKLLWQDELQLKLSMASETEVVLLGEGSMARVLHPGRTVIHPSSLEGPGCALVPLQRPAVATSTGLQYNLGEIKSLAAAGQPSFAVAMPAEMLLLVAAQLYASS